MPIYEYHCSKCDCDFEQLQKMDEENLTLRPDCGKDCSLVKQISRTSFRLSGSGWYATDYKGNNL